MCQLFLIFSLFIAVHARAMDPHYDCEPALKSPAAISFPQELRLPKDKVEILLKNEKFAPLVEELGSIFHLLESQPEILARLPFALNSRIQPPRIGAGLPRLLREQFGQMPEAQQRRFAHRYLQFQAYYGDGMLENDQIAWLAFLMIPLEVAPAFAPEFDRDLHKPGRLKLAQLQKPLSQLPKHRAFFEDIMKPHAVRQLLGQGIDNILLRILSQGYTLPEDQYLESHRKIVASVAEWESASQKASSLRTLSAQERYENNFSNLRAIVSLFVVAPALAGKIKHNIGEGDLENLVAENRGLVLEFLEDVYFETDFKKYDHQVYMDIMDMIVYGTPLPYAKIQILNAAIETSSRLLLPAKNYVSQLKALNSLEVIQLRAQNLRILPFELNLKAEEGSAISAKKRQIVDAQKMSRAGENSSAEVTPDSEIDPDDDLKQYTKFANERRSLRRLTSENLYKFRFLRNGNQITQHLIFDPDSLIQVAKMPTEAYLVLDGLVSGFTSRHHPGAGLKRIHHRTGFREDLYEARPNRGQYRMIISRKPGFWTVLSFVRKTEFQQELERLRNK